MKAVRPWTMTSYFRIFALVVAVRYVVDRDVPGDMVECGVWRGGSMQAVARTLLGRGVSDRDLHLFDTFEGMPEPTDEDRRVGGPPARELLESSPQTARSIWAIADLPDVQAGMSRTGYPADRIHYHAGLVQDTIPAQAPEQIALLRLDTDWYESTRHELAHLYDRVPSGGVRHHRRLRLLGGIAQGRRRVPRRARSAAPAGARRLRAGRRQALAARQDVAGPGGALPVRDRWLGSRAREVVGALDELVAVDVARAVREDLARAGRGRRAGLPARTGAARRSGRCSPCR